MGRRPWWQDEQRPYEDEAVVWTATWLEVTLGACALAVFGILVFALSRWALAGLAFLLVPKGGCAPAATRRRTTRPPRCAASAVAPSASSAARVNAPRGR